MIDAAFLMLLAIPSSQSSVAEPATIVLGADRLLRVQDLAHVARGGELVIARLPSAALLSTREQEQLVRNRVPGVAFALRHAQDVKVELPVSDPKIDPVICMQTVVPVAAGRLLSADDVISAPCGAKPDGKWLVTSRAGYRARIDIPRNVPLGRLDFGRSPGVDSGTPVIIRTHIGAVIIERQAHTLQEGRAGHNLFVQTNDGKVFSAPLDVADAGARP